MNFPEVLEQFESDASELVVPASNPTMPSRAPDTDPSPPDWEVLEGLRRADASIKTLKDNDNIPRVLEISTDQIP